MANYLMLEQKRLGLKADGVLGPKTAAAMMADWGIRDKLFFAHMIGQCRVESGDFKQFRENLNYSAQGLANTWARFAVNGKRGGKPNALAASLARQPKAIANNVYALRMGNGNAESGDGWFYRGGLGIQITGRTNWLRFFEYAELPANTDPDSLEGNSRLFFLGAKFWFIDNHADVLCTGGNTQCMLNVSRKVNLGTTATVLMPLEYEQRLLATTDMLKMMGLV